MRILITGACGFVGSSLALELARSSAGIEIVGFDNLWRPGSELNRVRLRAAGIRVVHGDARCASDFEGLPKADWVIDAAANASVLAGVDGATTPRQLIEHNLIGTVNVLEHCRRHGAGLILLSSSRVYSITGLNTIALVERGNAYAVADRAGIEAVSAEGVTEAFPTGAPASLYGATKLASEQLALEYAEAFDMPLWIDRCGVLAGAGQFGQPAQGIFSWWLHRWRARRPLKYLGFGGRGLQVRDCLHPRDLAGIIRRQVASAPARGESMVHNVSGGAASAMSLAELSAWCEARFGPFTVAQDGTERRFDVPWVVLDSARARRRWDWSPAIGMPGILAEIADHADAHPEWLEVSEG